MRLATAISRVTTICAWVIVGGQGGLFACSSAAGSGGTTGAAAHSCAFQTRQVQHCGGATPLGDWTTSCQDGPCPTALSDNFTEYADLSGSSATGTCSTISEYRDVFDFEGACSDWMQAGAPLTGPTPIYCGHSLIYNEFTSGSQSCDACAAANCSNEYVACCPSSSYAACSPQSTVPNDCDDLIRCLRACTAGDNACGERVHGALPGRGGPRQRVRDVHRPVVPRLLRLALGSTPGATSGEG
jgi:hypothetical protein